MSKDKKTAATPATPANQDGNMPASLPVELLPLYDWYVKEGRSWLTTAAIVLLVVLALLAFRRHQGGKSSEASAALASAESVESLENLNAQYGRTKVGPLIRIALARAYYEAGNFELARTTFEEFVKRHGKHEMAPAARLGIAAALEGAQEFDQALAAFAAFDKEFPAPHYLNALAAMGQARCLAALQRKEEALDTLDRLIVTTTDTTWEEEVRALRPVIERFEGFKTRSIFDQLGVASQSLAAEAVSLDALLDTPIQSQSDESATPVVDAPPAEAGTATVPETAEAAQPEPEPLTN